MAGQDKIRVLIVDDIADTREAIRRMLQFDQTIEVIGVARTGKEAIEQTQAVKPDVVLMDINMPDMDGIAATELIRKRVPFTQVIILSVQNDQNYMRRAMLVGARDFLAKPPMIDDLTNAIKRAGIMAQEERQKGASMPEGGGGGGGGSRIFTDKGKLIVVYSPKGGTGTTTLAVNLALALREGDKRVAVVDANLQFGDLAIFLNEQGKNSVLDLAPRVDELDQEVVESVMINHQASGLHLLASPSRPEPVEQVTGEQFLKLLNYLKKMYAYTVVDTSSFLSPIVAGALEAMDVMVLVTTQDIPSIKNANLFLSIADASGIRRHQILFVMNKLDRRIGITPEKVGESLRQPIVASIPYDDKIVPASVNRGLPFYLDNKLTPISKSILVLSDLVKEKLAKTEQVSEPAKQVKK